MWHWRPRPTRTTTTADDIRATTHQLLATAAGSKCCTATLVQATANFQSQRQSWERFATHMASAAAASTLASSSASSRFGSTAVPCIPHLAGVSPTAATSISSTPTSSVAAIVLLPDAGAVEAAATAGPAALLASAAAIAASAAGWGRSVGGGAWDESVGGAFGSSGRCRFSAGRITNTLVGST